MSSGTYIEKISLMLRLSNEIFVLFITSLVDDYSSIREQQVDVVYRASDTYQ